MRSPGTPTWASLSTAGVGEPQGGLTRKLALPVRSGTQNPGRSQPAPCNAGTRPTCAPETGQGGVLRPRGDAISPINSPSELLLPIGGVFCNPNRSSRDHKPWDLRSSPHANPSAEGRGGGGTEPGRPAQCFVEPVAEVQNL